MPDSTRKRIWTRHAASSVHISRKYPIPHGLHYAPIPIGAIRPIPRNPGKSRMIPQPLGGLSSDRPGVGSQRVQREPCVRMPTRPRVRAWCLSADLERVRQHPPMRRLPRPLVPRRQRLRLRLQPRSRRRVRRRRLPLLLRLLLRGMLPLPRRTQRLLRPTGGAARRLQRLSVGRKISVRFARARGRFER